MDRKGQLLADDVCPGISMVDGTGLTDAGDGNYTNKYHLAKNEIAQCLNNNDLYIDDDCAYLSPQGLWALRFLRRILLATRIWEAQHTLLLRCLTPLVCIS